MAMACVITSTPDPPPPRTKVYHESVGSGESRGILLHLGRAGKRARDQVILWFDTGLR